LRYPNEKGEILASESTNPTIEQTFNVVTESEGEDGVDDLRHGPILLKAVTGDTAAVVSGDIFFTEAGYFGGNLVVSFVVVNETILLLLECNFVGAFLACGCGFWRTS